MKKVKKYLKLTIGSLIIGATINLFYVGKCYGTTGLLGASLLYSGFTKFNLGLTVLLLNIFFMCIAWLILPKKYVKRSLAASALIPLFICLTQNIRNIINIKGADPLLIILFGSLLLTIGYKFIHDSKALIGAPDLINKIGEKKNIPLHSVFNLAIDGYLLLTIILKNDFECFLYTVLSMMILEILIKRIRLGIGDKKVFYIITKEEKKVKKFIIENLHYELTVIDTKGGFTNNKNKILMTVIPTKDYYRLKEGIKEIDESAFISITDSYEAINNSF